jgi:Ca2+:H+ antiporter
LAYLQVPPLLVFISAAAAIIPLAEWIRRGTDQVAQRAGPAIGGLLNVSFGNAAELILSLFVLTSGSVSVVKATITGSIVGNSLLGLGLAVLVGSWGRPQQTFKRERAGLLASLLILAVLGLLAPALFDPILHAGGVGGTILALRRYRLGVSVSAALPDQSVDR